jgi:hypothetical protein
MRLFKSLILSVLLLSLLLSCSSDDTSKPEEPRDTEAPTVVSADPAEGTVDVPLLQPFTVTFSEAMDRTSLNLLTIELGSPAVPIGLHIPASAQSVVVQPDSLLHPDQPMALTISGATDLAGNALAPFTLNVTTGPLDCAHLADRFEPNDLPSTAAEVKTDTTYTGLATCLEDVDFFRITLQDTLKVRAETKIHYADEDPWQIYWTRADGQNYATLGTTARRGIIPSFQHTFLPGTYYVMIFGYEEEQRVLYDLRLRTEAPCVEDPFEDNDFEDEAAPVAAGSHQGLRGCYVDADWYSVPIAADKTLTLTMNTRDYTSHRRVTIIMPDGTRVSDTRRDETVTSISAPTTAEGDALVMCMVWADGIVYDMTIGIGD